jgi:ribonuclease P protein component
MIGRLLHKCDFERTLAMAPCSRSAHFALHYLYARPSAPMKPARMVAAEKLYTGDAPVGTDSVDNLISGHWLSSVVPKRHARRSVTRNMLRRQVREAMQRHETRLRCGLWLVRLRQPFAVSAFSSADSRTLRLAAAQELDKLLVRACR